MKKLIQEMCAGAKLWWFGDAGPELSTRPFWPQKRTVLAALKAGLLRWRPFKNQTQLECGICELELTDKGHASFNEAER